MDWDTSGTGTHRETVINGQELERAVWDENATATPPVKGAATSTARWHKFTLEGWAEDITNFSDGYDGQEITVFVADNDGPYVIEHDATKIAMADGTDLIPNAKDVLGFKLDGTVWRQTFYQNNSPKVKYTPIGGVAILLTNKTGGVSIAGTIVEVDDTTDDAFKLGVADGDEQMGIVLDSGIANGEEAWVVVSGIADVAMEDNTAATRGYWVRTSTTEAGYSDGTNPDPPGAGIGAVERHFTEIGHCMESVIATGGGTHILARCVVHFN